MAGAQKVRFTPIITLQSFLVAQGSGLRALPLTAMLAYLRALSTDSRVPAGNNVS